MYIITQNSQLSYRPNYRLIIKIVHIPENHRLCVNQQLCGMNPKYWIPEGRKQMKQSFLHVWNVGDGKTTNQHVWIPDDHVFSDGYCWRGPDISRTPPCRRKKMALDFQLSCNSYLTTAPISPLQHSPPLQHNWWDLPYQPCQSTPAPHFGGMHEVMVKLMKKFCLFRRCLRSERWRTGHFSKCDWESDQNPTTHPSIWTPTISSHSRQMTSF